MLNDHASVAAPRIVLVGAGRLARSILRTMPERITALIPRDPARAEELRAIHPSLPIAASLGEIDPSQYDLLWIATADSAIASTARSLAEERGEWKEIIAIHSSGATPPSALDPLGERGARTFALHPNGSFTGAEPIPAGLLWSISTNDPTSVAAARSLLEPIAPRIVVIRDEMRPLYHAAASVASNYSVTLFAAAVELYRRAGLSESDARDVVSSFIAGSAARAANVGAREALTGPIARGDVEVYRRQRDAVARDASEYLDLFDALAQATAVLAGRDLGRDHDVDGVHTSGASEEQSGQESAG